MKLIWQMDVPAAPDLMSLMQTVADCAALTEGITLPVAVHITMTDDEHIQALNRETRGVDASTDVLSYPTVRYTAGQTAASAEKKLRQEWDDELSAVMLGNLVISLPHLLAQAEAYGHSAAREAAFLLTHGLCHLMGYDHIEEDERKVMRAMEESILTSVGLSRDEENGVTDETLLALAKEAMKRAYAPYSHFRVGAALLCEDGRIYQGCNIENAAFSMTNCAERTAVFKAVSEGETRFTTIAIAAEGSAPWPCGACRQVLNEFSPGIRVMVTWDGHVDEKPLSELLPCGFGPASLGA